MRARGHSLMELTLVGGLFATFLVCMHLLMRSSGMALERGESSGDVTLQLQKARGALSRELAETRYSMVRTASLGVEAAEMEGDVLWFLSARTPETGEVTRDTDGSPFWRHNVLYYLTVPAEHDATYGAQCRGEACAHKMLVRRRLRRVPYPQNEKQTLAKEKLIPWSTMQGNVAAPSGPGMAGVGGEAEKTEVVAGGLVAMKVETMPDPAYTEEVRVTLTGFALDKAGQKTRTGQSLLESPYSTVMRFSVFPGN